MEDILSPNIKDSMMTRLKGFRDTKIPQNRYGSHKGKPIFPDLPEIVSELSLAYFIGADSWYPTIIHVKYVCNLSPPRTFNQFL